MKAIENFLPDMRVAAGVFFAGLAVILFLLNFSPFSKVFPQNPKPSSLPETRETTSPLTPPLSPGPSPTATPSPTLTFAQMNTLYGPCVKLSTLMYHHIQPEKTAQDKKQTAFTVDTSVFQKQMDYLKSRGYATVSMTDLTSFFDSGVPLPAKSVLLTFDDAYADFATDAFPILKSLGFEATVFTPTGLVNNPDYLNWGTISEIASSGLVEFANHTWSHKNVNGNREAIEKEITTADTQLSDQNQNNPKVFAYPYGADNSFIEGYLAQKGYKLAFTTRPGSILCTKQRFSLPRIRIGNSSLSAYGF